CLGNIPVKTITFKNGKSGPVFFNVSGKTPATIEIIQQKWAWYYRNINSSSSPKTHIATSANKLFILLAQPRKPWTQTGQTKPWADVLDLSCKWARGENTPEGAAAKITRRMYDNLGGIYQSIPYYTDECYSSFNLDQFMNNISCIGGVNCCDMGKSLVIFSNSVGCHLVYNESQ
ncbi:MAG: hypothetical protein GY950_24410, partial [bacterium]|nr:hypothetical protein [bacterium]